MSAAGHSTCGPHLAGKSVPEETIAELTSFFPVVSARSLTARCCQERFSRPGLFGAAFGAKQPEFPSATSIGSLADAPSTVSALEIISDQASAAPHAMLPRPSRAIGGKHRWRDATRNTGSDGAGLALSRPRPQQGCGPCRILFRRIGKEWSFHRRLASSCRSHHGKPACHSPARSTRMRRPPNGWFAAGWLGGTNRKLARAPPSMIFSHATHVCRP